MTDHYFKAERLLEMAGTHTDTGDERDAALAALFAARAQAHATLALAPRHTEQPEPEAAPEPEAVPLWRAAEAWGDDIEVQSLEHPDVRWRVRGGRFLIAGGNKWRDLTTVSSAMVTLVSREPYRDDPWATPGEDVTMRLMVGDTPPEGTILSDVFGDLYRAEADGTFTTCPRRLQSRGARRSWRHDLSGYAPLYVATPEQITAAGIRTGDQQ